MLKWRPLIYSIITTFNNLNYLPNGYFLTAQAQATHSHSLDYKLECPCVQINHAQLSWPINSVKASVLGCDKCWNITWSIWIGAPVPDHKSVSWLGCQDASVQTTAGPSQGAPACLAPPNNSLLQLFLINQSLREQMRTFVKFRYLLYYWYCITLHWRPQMI